MFLDELTPGRRFDFPGEIEVTEEDIVAFARRFDPQPFHMDKEAARTSLFNGLAASGWHTAALTMAHMVKHFMTETGIIGVGAELQWPRPTRPGDRLRVSTEVVEVRPSRSKPQGMVKLRTTTVNAAGEVVQVFTGTIVVPTRPAT